MLTSDAILAAPSIPPCNTTLPSPRIVPVESTSTLTSGALAQYTTGRNAGPNLLVTQDLCALLQSTVLESASFPLASSVTSALGSSAVGKVTALPVQPLISAPISESSRVEATRSGLNFLSPNHHGCVYAPMALNWLRVVGSLLRWRRMVGILKRQNWSDGWHGMCGKFEGARLLWFHIALCSLQFRTLLAFRVAFNRFAHISRKRTVIACSTCLTPARRYDWFNSVSPFFDLWHPEYQHPLCSATADLGFYCTKFCPRCAQQRSYFPLENDLWHVIAEDQLPHHVILHHPDYNARARHMEQAVIDNMHLPADQRDKRYRGAIAESGGISPSRAADLGIRSGSRCIQPDALGTGSSYNVTAELGDELAFGGGVDEGIDFMFEDFDQCDACGFDCDY